MGHVLVGAPNPLFCYGEMFPVAKKSPGKMFRPFLLYILIIATPGKLKLKRNEILNLTIYSSSH